MKKLTVETLGDHMGGIYTPKTVRSLLSRDPGRLPPPLKLGGEKRTRKIWLSNAVDAWLLEKWKSQHPDLTVVIVPATSQVCDVFTPSAVQASSKRRPGRPRKLEAVNA